MDPHPLANLFKKSNYDEPIASELSALDYLYEVLLENRESENCDEVFKEEIYKVIHDSSLNEKHDCNNVIINSINVNCVNDMQNYKLGDDDFVMSTTYCNDHDWGEYDPTCNYYERGKYGCRNFHVTKLPLVMLRSSMFYSSSMHMLDISFLDNLFAYKIPMHRKYVRLKCVCHIFHDFLF